MLKKTLAATWSKQKTSFSQNHHFLHFCNSAKKPSRSPSWSDWFHDTVIIWKHLQEGYHSCEAIPTTVTFELSHGRTCWKLEARRMSALHLTTHHYKLEGASVLPFCNRKATIHLSSSKLVYISNLSSIKMMLCFVKSSPCWS